jgi:hypothetical protein
MALSTLPHGGLDAELLNGKHRNSETYYIRKGSEPLLLVVWFLNPDLFCSFLLSLFTTCAWAIAGVGQYISQIGLPHRIIVV